MVLSGCYPVSQLQGARTVPKGEVQVAAAAVWTPQRWLDPNTNDDGYPGPALAVRAGLLDRLDVGLHLRLSSVQLGAKYQLTRGEVDLALSETLVLARDGIFHFDDQHPHVSDDANVAASKTALYIGVGGDGAVAPWVAPTIDIGMRSNRLDGAHYEEPFGAAGALLGCTFKLGSMFRIQPELGFAMPVLGAKRFVDATGGYELPLGPGDIRTEATVAFMLQI